MPGCPRSDSKFRQQFCESSDLDKSLTHMFKSPSLTPCQGVKTKLLQPQPRAAQNGLNVDRPPCSISSHARTLPKPAVSTVPSRMSTVKIQMVMLGRPVALIMRPVLHAAVSLIHAQAEGTAVPHKSAWAGLQPSQAGSVVSASWH